MLFVLGISVGFVIAVLLMLSLANFGKNHPPKYFIETNRQTHDLLTTANVLRERQAAALEKSVAHLASPNSRYATARGVLNSYINDGGKLGDSVGNLFNWVDTRLNSAKPNIT